MISNNFFRKSYPILRDSGNGSYVRGVWTPTGQNTATTIVSIQPISGMELESLNIGQRSLGKVKAYTNEEYKIAVYDSNNTIKVNGDVLIFRNEKYEVIQKLPNQSNIINHFKYVAEYRGEYTP